MTAPGRGSGRTALVIKVSVVMMALLFVSAPTFANSSGHSGHTKASHRGGKWDPTIQQMVASSCEVGSSVQSCTGGYTATQTFGSPLPVGDIVTLTMIFAATSASSATLAFSDTLGNAVTLVSQQCTPTAPTLCTAVAYFLVTNGGYDDLLFTVQGGVAGSVHYTAEDWFASNSNLLTPLGANGYCNGTCTTTLSMTAINFGTAPNEAIAVGTSEAYFSGALASWTPSFSQYYFADCTGSSGGYALLMQSTNSTATSYTFSSTTSSTATMFAGSAEVLYV
ncbi:MAG: hypothetical protein JRN16_03760 [Nitrososphaerota archaeon]|nr:hypothetical protein [Nitrososphaerota archaeon]MDG7027509.1 hypothetical protein [Nitrososphaerota archaeon]